MTELRLAGVGFERDGRTVLAAVECVARPGSLTVIAGPNGAGKSTLLQICAGLLSPSTGEVLLGGARLSMLRPRERARRIAHLAQAGVAAGPFRVRELLLQQRYAHQGLWPFATKADEAACESMLREAELADLAERRPAELSGGERQRLALALALVRDPEVLLLDEPAAALDVAHQVTTFRRLRALADRGKTVVAVSHDLNLAAAVADVMLILVAGRVAVSGTPAEVLRRDVLERCFGVAFTEWQLPGLPFPLQLPLPPFRDALR